MFLYADVSKAIRVKPHNNPALTISRAAYKAKELVYVAVANRALRYEHGRSCIAYFGTTKRGARRIAGSAAWKAETLLQRHGLQQLDFYVVTCGAGASAKAARKLERALIIRFRERFGSPPLGNSAGRRMRWNAEWKNFSYNKLDKIIDNYS